MTDIRDAQPTERVPKNRTSQTGNNSNYGNDKEKYA